jgi:hypothetical protein
MLNRLRYVIKAPRVSAIDVRMVTRFPDAGLLDKSTRTLERIQNHGKGQRCRLSQLSFTEGEMSCQAIGRSNFDNLARKPARSCFAPWIALPKNDGQDRLVRYQFGK